MRQVLDPEAPLSPESIDRLRHLADMPDDSIRIDLIPELPREAWAKARKNPYAAMLRDQSQRKAS